MKLCVSDLNRRGVIPMLGVVNCNEVAPEMFVAMVLAHMCTTGMKLKLKAVEWSVGPERGGVPYDQ